MEIDIYPPLTQQERRDVEAATDPRRDWPSRAEAEQDREDSSTLAYWRAYSELMMRIPPGTAESWIPEDHEEEP